VALRDLVDWVGRDAARYFLVSRKGDAEFTFDLDLAVTRTEENPVYYVQYAHARICSVLQQAAERGCGLDDAAACEAPLGALAGRHALQLIAQLASWPDVVSSAARELAPHQVPNYLKDVSADFHAFYNTDRVLVDDPVERNARLALLLATRQVLRNGLAMIGVSAPERM
jgi:arginyl-tRNA synthetase